MGLARRLRGRKRTRPGGETISESLDSVTASASRIGELARDLLVFARGGGKRDKFQRFEADPDKVVRASLRMVRGSIMQRAKLEVELEEVPTVVADESRLAQVVMNLLVNASHAIPDGERNENTITVRTRRDDHNNVLIEVRDTGCGIDDSLLERIFEPFFSTKDEDGTGLGLAICKELMEEHGGTIRVDSRVGKGSTFTVVLPAFEPTS